MLNRITDFSSSPKGKWIVVAVWLVLAGLIIPLAPMLSDVTENDSSSFLPEGAESTQVQELVDERFPSDTTPAIVVFHNADGLTDEQKAFADTLGTWAAVGRGAGCDRPELDRVDLHGTAGGRGARFRGRHDDDDGDRRERRRQQRCLSRCDPRHPC